MSVVAPKTKINPLLAAYLAQLNAHPLRTKAITAGTLSFLQEILASYISSAPIERPPKNAPAISHALAKARITPKTFKMAAYGAFISAPLGHVLLGALQRAFAGKTGTGAKIAQILANNLLLAPIQAAIYLASMAVINGANTVDGVSRVLKRGFMGVMRVTWMTSPLAMVIAQKFIPQELWVAYFNVIGFVLGTYFTLSVKRAQMKELKKDGERKSA